MKEQPAKRGATVIHKKHRRMPSSAEFDVCVCGGTLGIFVATALQVFFLKRMPPITVLKSFLLVSKD